MPQAIRVVDRLQDQADVNISSPSNGHLLTYNSATGRWENRAASTYTPPRVGATPLAIDTFTRTTSASTLGTAELGGAWILTGAGTIGIVNGVATGTNSTECVALLNPGRADVWYEVQLLHDYADPVFRCNAAGTDYLAIQMHSGLAGYYSLGPNGGITGTPRTDMFPTAGDVIAVACYGGCFVTYVNGVPFNASSASQAGSAARRTQTYFGFRNFTGPTFARWDNLAIRALDTFPQLIADGDSLTHGDGAATSDSGWPEQVIKAVPAYRGWPWIYQNLGIFGGQLANMVANAPAAVDAYYGTAHSRNVCAIWGGTNDLNNAGGTPAATYAMLKTYWAQRRAAGWTVLAFTFLPRSDAGKRADWETQRQALNTLVRSDPTLYDALIDVGNDATIGQAGQSTNTTYYNGDGLHLTVAGYAIIAGLVLAALAALP